MISVYDRITEDDDPANQASAIQELNNLTNELFANQEAILQRCGAENVDEQYREAFAARQKRLQEYNINKRVQATRIGKAKLLGIPISTHEQPHPPPIVKTKDLTPRSKIGKSLVVLSIEIGLV